MWARVKYTLDSWVANVPLTFFKDYKEIEKELQKPAIIREEYRVFYSDDGSDTPESILKRENRILDVDSVMGKSNIKVRVAGYYKATLNLYADTEEDLLKNLESTQSRRKLKPTVQEKKKVSNQEKKRKVKENMKEAHNYNMKKFKIGYADASSSDTDTENLKKNTNSQKDRPTNQKTEDLQYPSGKVKPQGQGKNFREKEKGSTDFFPFVEESHYSSVEDNVLCADCKEKVDIIKELRDKLKRQNDEILKLQQAVIKAKDEAAKWKSKAEDAEGPQKNVDSLKRRVVQLEKDRQEYIDLNKWWQQKEIRRKSKTKSPSYSSSHNKIHLHSHSSSSSKRSHHGTSSRKTTSISSQSPEKSPISLLKSPSTPSTPTAALPDRPNHVKSSPAQLSITQRIENLETADSVDLDGVSALDTTNGSTLSTAGNAQRVNNDLPCDPVQIEETGNRNGVTRVNTDVTEADRQILLDREDEEPAFGITLDGVTPLSYAQFKACRLQGMKGKPGTAGDSMCVKNLAAALWPAETLITRSATGRQATVSNKEARPQLTPVKKKYCADLLAWRIRLEEPLATKEDIAKRTSSAPINKHLMAKIKALRRGLQDRADD